MGMTNFRSLLLAAIVLSNCVPWIASRHHFKHNVNGHRSRHRRQGTGLFLPASYVIPGGEGEGAWGEWGEVSACSRTCGGGVAKQKRICLEVSPDGQPLCKGGDTKYFSCQTQDCPDGALDFRAEQCAQYNDKLFNGNRYNWVPYTRSLNPCELNCMPHGERFYYRQQPKVVDGTRCNDESFDVCVDGVCQPVGCDMMLGSNAREDKCRHCRGNGTNCHTISGVIDSIEFRLGYNDVLLIPQGATNIIIEEQRASSNYLALRAKTDNVYYLNGQYHIDFPRSLMIVGTLWHYERSQQGLAAPDKLKCLGPTTEPLYLSILLQEENVGIAYEYSVPSALAPPPNQNYNWVFDEFSECNATCGGGYQQRQVTCRSRDDLNVMDENLCDVNFKPVTNQSCNTDACPPTWVQGAWGACSKPCGQGGTRSREVYCEKIITNGATFRFQSKVADKECFDILGPKPEAYQECNQNATCPTWFTGPWTHCDKLCGVGKQTRQVICHQKVKGRVEVFDDAECGEERPPAEQQCLLHPCDGVDWVLSEWSGCDTCLSTVRSRTAQCTTKSHEVIDPSFCSYHPTPVLEEPCDTAKLPPCQVLWYASQWSNCSVQCGKGVQTRDVFCGLYDGESVTKVNDEQCDGESKFITEKECEVPIEKCPAKWFAGAWSECSKSCGGGEQSRQVMCLNGGKESNDCPQDLVLDLRQPCNEGPCDKDEILPMDSKSTPIIEEYDYEDCEEEEEYPDEAAEAITTTERSYTHFPPYILVESDDDLIEGDTSIKPDEGSGYTDLEETGTFSDLTDSTYEATESWGSTDYESTPVTTEITDETGSTMSSEESSTEPTGSTSESGPTESIETSETDYTETTEMGTSDSTATDSTEITDSDATYTSESESTGTTELNTEESTETSPTGTTEFVTTVTSESVPSESTTEQGTTETSGSSLTISSELSTTETSESSPSETTESGTTESTDSSPTETTELATSDTSESVTSESTTEVETTETTESGSTETSDLSTTETSETSPSETTELVTSESTESSLTEITELATSSTSESGTSESTTETGTSEATESGSTETSELSTTETSGASASETTELVTSESTESGSTETTELLMSSTSESSTSESTTESGTTETTESGSTETSESSTTETSESSPTETTELRSTDSTEFSITETTEVSTTSAEPETTESTEMVTVLTTESGPTETTVSGSTESTETETTPWIWTTIKRKRPQCKPKKTAKCHKSKFGCCPDKRTPATGPFDEGCPQPETCHQSKFGCCPDGVSPAHGPHNKGCEVAPCNQTLYGCCKSDNITAAEGNDQEGCPPACKSSEFGCCKDDETKAKGPEQQGCPETETTGTEKPTPTEAGGCETTEFGCCFDNETDASGPNGEGCPCSISEFGCCPDGIATARGVNLEGCVMSCNTSAYGCCPDGETPAHGPEYEGCCLQYEFGCCPDNYKPAEGPHLEGCGCKTAHFGCCPDNVTIARGPNNDGCGCQYTQFGCCPDRRTESQGPEFEGCACHTYQFGCCPDGVTAATGPSLQGCLCQYSKYGCCGDDVTAAKGPNKEGCDCSNSKFGCCPDGTTEAKGEKFLNCSDLPENKQAACALPSDKGSCGNYSVYWFYDVSYGGCVRFWYGGCEGNGNRFLSQEECEDVCVRPPPKDSCNLPKVKGVCDGYNIRWYYDGDREQCSQFVYGGCLGNNNNFDSQELCQERCEPEKTEDQCNLPIEEGPCAGNFVRWGYDAQRRRCEQFIWGGCEGNSNRFSSEAACKLRCSPPGAPIQACSLPQDAGNCTEKYPAWSFSATENRCMPFYYTGCGGNDNRFDSERACAGSCPSAYVQEMCTLPAVTGDCAEYTQRWYYDTKHRRCRQFYYGGCGGNENNFLSEFECESRCMEQVVTTTGAPPPPISDTPAPRPRPDPERSDFCFEPIDSGPCSDMRESWAYDSARGACTPFQYGGCGGNRNNFPTLDYCQYYCAPAQDVCQLPMLAGPCDASLMRWFYDSASDSCSQFTYGGCDGNANRFNSLEECERQCRSGPVATTTTTTTTTMAPIYVPPECQVSPTLEECREVGKVWYLDVQQRACVVHINSYSGLVCRNTGVYPSQEACMRSCGAFRDLDVCRFPVDPGPCQESIPKVYFDMATGRCDQFAYGGCHGGPNRFSSVEECEQVCRPPDIDPCNQQPELGDCTDYRYMWHYDAARDACNQFVYGGCNGNSNRFGTQQECENRCKKGQTTTVGITFGSSTTAATRVPSTTISPFGPNELECATPTSVEPCGANVTVYYYDTKTQACLVGDFGGCRHPNSYRTEEECERRCGAFKGLDVCGASLDPGPCLAAITKYYWDAVSGRCLGFAYGGCHGGPNRFSSIEECEEVCGATGPEAACLQPVSTGELGCQLSSRRWYYNDVYGECLAFVYSGCGGSDNNFHSYESCAVACKRASPAEVHENEVSCDSYVAECAALRCEYAVQRTRTAGGCERCVCVPVDVDCTPLRQECDTLKCNYGLQRTTGDDGCERCRCIEHPCLKTRCTTGERCVTTAYRDALSLDMRYSAECRIVNKTGSCPPRTVSSTTEGQCRIECNDDADCVGVGKCCDRGCSRLCLEPASLVQSSPAPPHTTFSPELPHAPRPSEKREPEVRAQEGGKATLRCFFHGNPPPRIIWRYGEITIDGDVGRYRLLSDGALEIISLYRNDTGVYICVAENGLGIATQEIRLEVLDPVEGPAGISGTPNAVVMGEMGRSLSIRCLAYGYPQPAIYWYRGQNGPMVPYSSSLYEARGNVLQIRRLMPETLGEYICQAYNGYGKPADWAFVVQAYRTEASEGYPYLVSRQTERSVPAYEYERQTEPTTARTTEIEIPYSVPVRTRIVTDRTRVSAGSEINLPCDVDGFPVPEVYWTKDGVQIQRQPASDRIYVTEARLTITRANTEDSGVYGCHANNGYTSDYSTVQISVEGLYIPPNCKDSPYFANCNLIVKSKFCHHKYYSTFCCKSCVEAGQLDPNEMEMQADTAWRRK